MTDETTDDTGAGETGAGHEGDSRDERVAALLEVPPLDDVTRRRLVRDAVDAVDGAEGASPARSRRRGLVAVTSVAAVLVAGLVAIGVALSSGDEGTTTAASAPDRAATTTQPAPSAESDGTKAQVPAPSASDSAAGPLPDLGDLDDAQALADRVRAFTPQERAARTESAVPCARTLRDDGIRDLDVVGRGTDGGRPVVVLVGTRDGERVAVSVLPDSCEVARLVAL